MPTQGLSFPPFEPKWMLAGPHAQTIGSIYYPYWLPTQETREHIVKLPDGDSVVVHENLVPATPESPRSPACTNQRGSGRVILLVHGLGGTHRSYHVARLAFRLASHGWTCLRMDQRGCGSGLTLAKRPTHAGRSDDLDEVVRYVQSQWPGQPITIIGFSLGGNLLLKLLAEYGSQFPEELDSAIAVAPAMDLAACSANLKVGVNWFYDRVFLRALNQIVNERRQRVDGCVDLAWQSAPKSLLEFDNEYTAPLAGFRNAEEYYFECSSSRRLRSIRVKTWMITSRDDPLVPFQIFTEMDPSDAISFHATDRGGHLGFVARKTTDPDPFWLDWRMLEIVASLP